MKRVFVDTNVVIALTFIINSLHSNAEKVFDEYSEIYWSYAVLNEFHLRFITKEMNAKKFFHDLKLNLECSNKELYSCNDLRIFVKRQYSGKLMDDAESSINPFWNEYIGFESYTSFFNIMESIDFCLKDLSITLNIRKEKLENELGLSPPRTVKYFHIDKMLEDYGVHQSDREIILDAHDFACNDSPIDFVTFDHDCYEGAKNVELLCFNSVRGKNDFN